MKNYDKIHFLLQKVRFLLCCNLIAASFSYGQVIIPPNPADTQAVAAGQITSANAIWWGFDSTNVTPNLQAALYSRATKLRIPNVGQPWLVDPLFLSSNKEITLDSGVVLLARKGSFRGNYDRLLSATDVHDVSIIGYGAEVRMNQADYTASPYTEAEWRSCLNIMGCSNINVFGLKLVKSGGDGIGIAGNEPKGNHHCSNIHIKDCVCDSNYRNEISVCSAQNLLIENCVLSNTNGTMPNGGIDFEPDFFNDTLINCTVRNCKISNNYVGIYVSLHEFNVLSCPVSITIDSCYVHDNYDLGDATLDVWGAEDTTTITYLGYLVLRNNQFIGTQYFYKMKGLVIDSTSNMVVTFSVTPDTLPAGGGVVTLLWTSLNVDSAKIDNGIGSVPTNGSKLVTITANTVFKLTLYGKSGSTTYVDSVIVRTPLPTGIFTVKPDTLQVGGGIDTLKWTSQNADSAIIDNGLGKVAPNGSMTVPVTKTTVFRLTLYGKSGSTKYVDSVIVRTLLPTGTFTATPDTLPVGGGVDTLRWTSQNADSTKIDNGIGRVATNESMTVPVTKTTIFRLTLYGKSGSTTYVDTVVVRTLLPTGTFTASPDTVSKNGGKVTFKWTSQNATSAIIDNGIGTVQPNGSIASWVYNTTTFKLTLTGQYGSTTYIDSVFALVPPTGTFTIISDTLPIGGGMVALQWISLNATSAKIDNGIGSVPPNGSKTRTVTASTVFELTLTGPAGSITYIDSVIVAKPPTGTFTVTPDTLSIIPGTATLRWTSENAICAEISPTIGKLDSTSGCKTVTVTTNTVFELKLSGPFGLTTTYVDSVIVIKPITGIKSISTKPLDYTLSQNYPNPFNSSTMIEYELPCAGFTTLKIYNLLGVLVSSLVSGYSQPGKYTIVWDASRCTSGMYLYRLQTGAFTTTRKLLLLR